MIIQINYHMNEIYSGFCAGIAQTAVGHPFDTVKVLIQNKSFKYDFKFRKLYRGWRYPMAMSTIFNSVLFPINKEINTYTNNIMVSGLLSGAIVSPIVYGFDIGKIKEQTNQKIVLKDFYRTPGLISTTIRESLAISIYFGSYYHCKDKYNIDPFFSGGIAGILNWTFTYPIDVIRSRQIAQNISIPQAIAQKQLWRGFSVCIARAAIANACIFKVYEITKNKSS